MANIFPFKGWRYNSELINDYTKVIVPPYDVITADEQNDYYNTSPYNYIRINLNRSKGDDRYIDAAKFLESWKNESVLVEESYEVIYILSQSFQQDGRSVDRVGCICTLELTELGETVLPHEQTIEKHLDDRYRLMETTKANPGQIFMCYQDENLILEKMYATLQNEPDIDCDLDKIRYRLWAVADLEFINQFKACMSTKDVVIADGHHRYKTALRFYRNNPEINGADRVMVTVVNSSNPGMNVLPTHRLIRDVQLGIDDIIKRLNADFNVERFAGPEKVINILEGENSLKGQMGIYHRESDTGLLLNFHNWKELNNVFTDQCQTAQKLDTNILHSFVMKDVFGVNTYNQQDLKKLSYMRGNKPTLELLKEENNFDVACFIKPPSLNEIFTIAEAGEKMPQKSTYFFPKVYSGLVTRCFSK